MGCICEILILPKSYHPSLRKRRIPADREYVPESACSPPTSGPQSRKQEYVKYRQTDFLGYLGISTAARLVSEIHANVELMLSYCEVPSTSMRYILFTTRQSQLETNQYLPSQDRLRTAK
jgi:hypothetical protein